MKDFLIISILLLTNSMVSTSNITSLELIEERVNEFIQNKYTATLDLSNINMEKIIKLGPFVRKQDPLVTAYRLIESLSFENKNRIKKINISNCNLAPYHVLRIFQTIKNHLTNLTTIDFSNNESAGITILACLNKLQYKSSQISNINMRNTISKEAIFEAKEMHLKLSSIFNLEI